MKKLLIPEDKANHVVYGWLIYFFFGFFFTPLITFGIVVLGGAAKEIIYDKILDKGSPEILDFFATISIPLLLILKLYLC